MLDLKQNKNILIKTYPHDSGLLYLALSLYEHLKKLGHNVYLIPKEKYVKTNGKYSLTYSKPADGASDLFINIDNASKEKYITNTILENKISTIISLETYMGDLNWIREAKMLGIKIIEVPMIEWVSASHFKKMFYNIFDEIWCLTNFGFETFNRAGYKNVKRITWNFVDEKLFNLNRDMMEQDFYFYHQASINPDYSSKNTSLVLRAFNMFLEENLEKQPKLILTGKPNLFENKEILENNKNIKYNNNLLKRTEIASIYKNVNCVVAPSSREGLGLSLYEARACGCKVITTDTQPMNQVGAEYLCKPLTYEWDGSLVPVAKLSPEVIYEQMKKAYEEHYVR